MKTIHKCAGHLRLRIVVPGSPDALIRYDHGNGVYPIAAEDSNPGFTLLPDETRAVLNGDFHALGFDAADLGLSE